MSGIGWAEFGRKLVEEIVTADRVRETLSSTVAGAFETEVTIAGGLVRAEGSGAVWRVDVDRLEEVGEQLSFAAFLHTDLDLTVRVSGLPYRYAGKALVRLQLRTVLGDDLTIRIDVPPVTAADVTLELTPKGKVAQMLDQIGGVSDQVQREIASFANAKKEEPAALEARVIDLRPTIEAEWERRRT